MCGNDVLFRQFTNANASTGSSHAGASALYYPTARPPEFVDNGNMRRPNAQFTLSDGASIPLLFAAVWLGGPRWFYNKAARSVIAERAALDQDTGIPANESLYELRPRGCVRTCRSNELTQDLDVGTSTQTPQTHNRHRTYRDARDWRSG